MSDSTEHSTLSELEIALERFMASRTPDDAHVVLETWQRLRAGDRLVRLPYALEDAWRDAAIATGLRAPWAPGEAMPPGGRGYTLEEALGATRDHPGWQALVRESMDAVECAGAGVVQMKEKFGRLRVYCRPLGPDGTRLEEPVAETLRARLGEIENRSASVCDQCGAPGTVARLGSWLVARCQEHTPEDDYT